MERNGRPGSRLWDADGFASGANGAAPAGRQLIALYRILLVIVLILAAVIVLGTVYGLLRKALGPGKESTQSTAVEGEESGENAGESIFSGIGKLRVATADPEPETVVISVAFPYDQNDRPFAEELASRIPELKSVTSEYLGAFSAEQLMTLEVTAIKGDLLDRYNALLKLGKISDLYVTDFMRL
jgi:flagellar FliL protein